MRGDGESGQRTAGGKVRHFMTAYSNRIALMAATVVAGLILGLCPPAAKAADTRADFLRLIDRPRVALAGEIRELPSTRPVEEFAFSYAADSEQRVPGILMKSVTGVQGRRPVVIALHGTGGNKFDELPLLRKLVNLGFIAVAIDGR